MILRVHIAAASALGVLGLMGTAQAHHLGESSAWERILSAADHAHDRHRDVEAERGYAEAERLATRADNKVYARFHRALALKGQGRGEDARALLFALRRQWPKHDKAPRALYVAARIRELHLKDAAGAEKEYLRMIARYPSSESAARSMWRMTELRAARSLDAALDFLRDLYHRHRRGDLGARALYASAQLFDERANLPEDAVRLYELLARRYPKSGLRDDALWRAAELHRAAHRPRRALTLLRRIVREKRDSWSFGSYNSIHLDKAALRVAEILLDDLKDPKRAVQALRDFIDGFPHSFLRWRARGLLACTLVDVNRLDEAADAVRELRRHHPRSRWTRVAEARLAAARGR